MWGNPKFGQWHSMWLLATAWLAASASQAAVPNLNGGTWHAVNRPHELRTIKGELPPLLPDARKIYDQHRAAADQGDRSFDVTETCRPAGLPRIFYTPHAFEFLQRDELIAILFEDNRLMRLIDMNVPQRELIGPTYLGQSVGYWQGNTLVIGTIGFTDNTVLDSAGLPHSDQMALTERFTVSKDGNTINARFVINDPKMYASTWETALTFKRDPKGRIAEDICPERQKLNWGKLK
jgi:hypothetical protein